VQPVAVKIFPTHATPQQHAEFQREVVLLKSCRDGNIVQFLGASQTENQTLMITECALPEIARQSSMACHCLCNVST
jgi:serine/threonine protein kinase